MIGQTGCDGGGALYPMMAMLTHRKAKAQGGRIIAEIVDPAQTPHARRQGIAPVGQALAKGGIEPLNQGGGDPPAALGAAQQLLNQGSRAWHKAPLKLQSANVSRTAA